MIKRVVVKVGSSTVTAKGGGLDRENMAGIVRQLCDIADAGGEVLLVTSGAIASGMGLLKLKKRPIRLPELQAVAAIGQNHLMDVYSDLFRARGYIAGQVLLTQEDFNSRRRYLNIRETLQALLKHRAIPVINENDAVSNEEIKCGDNDRLSSLLADLVGAERLVILTDVGGLLDESGAVISVVKEVNAKTMRLVRKGSSQISCGGMTTKLEAARRVSSAGIECIIASGRSRDAIVKAARGEATGTLFMAQRSRHLARDRWIAFSTKPKGALIVDGGARDALVERNKSLLPSGVVGIQGVFKRGETVSVLDASLSEFGRGIVNYSSDEIEKIKGKKTQEIGKILGGRTRDEVIQRDDLVIL